MNTIEIYKIDIASLDSLQKISKQTFFETFASSNSDENMQHYLNEGFTLEKLTSELLNPNSEFYFAAFENDIIGYLKINFGDAQTELIEEKTLEIERIYVLKEFHGKSVGQILYDKALQIAKKNDIDYVWLGVWEENPRAIQFYKKNGFVAFDKHIFKLGNEEQTDIMMKLKLDSIF